MFANLYVMDTRGFTPCRFCHPHTPIKSQKNTLLTEHIIHRANKPENQRLENKKNNK